MYFKKKQGFSPFKHFQRLEDNADFQCINVLEEVPAADSDAVEGRLTYEKCYELVSRRITHPDRFEYYICGPTPVMDNAIKALKSLKVPQQKIFTEYFTVAPQEEDTISTRTAQQIKVITDAGAQSVLVEPKETILDAMLREGVDMPYSCKAGVCSSCKQKLIKGKVDIKTDLSLTDQEKKSGYILTCQAHPLDDEVTVDVTNTSGLKRTISRKIAIVAGGIIGLALILGMVSPDNKAFLALGEMNTGHENLACEDCHSSAKGTTLQQLRANMQFALGQRSSAVTFGSDNVDNKKCQSCHDRPNDRHPMHRFNEPRFAEARKTIGANQCESCHREHSGVRIATPDLGFCVTCHQDTELKNDPLDIAHVDLIAAEQWNTCLQCHDFHGNHIFETPHLMKDTFSIVDVKRYARGGPDPYGNNKEYLAKEAIDKIKKIIE